MLRINIDKFYLNVGDIAITPILYDGTKYIEVAVLDKPSLRCIFTYDSMQLVSSNISEQHIPYISKKVKKNKPLLEV